MRVLLLLCALLTACGGGGGSSGGSQGTVPPPPDPPPDLTAEVSTRWADAYDTEIAAYYEAEQDREQQMASNGQFGTPAHYQYFVQDALAYTAFWADDARAILADVETRGTVNRSTASGWVEDYRAAFMAYMLDHYDYLDQRGDAGEPFYTNFRNDLINGINAEFDQLQADV